MSEATSTEVEKTDSENTGKIEYTTEKLDLGPVRDRAAKALMASMRVEAEQNVTNGKYPRDLCSSALSKKINQLNTELVPKGGTVDCSVSADGTAWAVDVKLNDGTIFCSDSGRYVGLITKRKGSGVTVCKI